MLRGIDGPALNDGFLFEHAQVGEPVFNFVESSEHRRLVSSDLRLVGVAHLLSDGVSLAGVEEQLRCLRAKAPQGTWTLNPSAAVGAFEASRAAQRDGGIEGGGGYADLRICGRNATLSGCNVRAALDQLRRHSHGDFRERLVEGRGQ